MYYNSFKKKKLVLKKEKKYGCLTLKQRSIHASGLILQMVAES